MPTVRPRERCSVRSAITRLEGPPRAQRSATRSAGSSSRPSSTVNAKLARSGIAARSTAAPFPSVPVCSWAPTISNARATAEPIPATSTGRTPPRARSSEARNANTTAATAPAVPPTSRARPDDVARPCTIGADSGTCSFRASRTSATAARASPATVPGSTAATASPRTNAPSCTRLAPLVASRRSSARASRRSAPAVMPANASRSSAAEPPTSRTRRDAASLWLLAAVNASSGAVSEN
jgi:hypothetical protein